MGGTCSPGHIFQGFIATPPRNVPDCISFRDVKFSDQATTVTISVITDVPCHVWVRLTLVEPQIHTKTITRRGVPFSSELRFCFVAYEDNEQIEAGDTLTHSWVKPAWPFCTTKWCYFWGYRLGIISPSTSAIFKHHNVLAIPAPAMTLLILEPWSSELPPPPVMYLLILEPWGNPEPPVFQKMLEHWTS